MRTPSARRSFLPRPRRARPAPEPPTEDPEAESRPTRESLRARRTSDAARDLIAAKAKARAAAVAPPPPPVAVEPEPLVELDEVAEEAAPVSKHDAVATDMPGVYKFKPKRTSRRLLTIALLIGLVLTAYFGIAAYEFRSTASVGLAAIVVLSTAAVWAIRAGASITYLTVHQGQLEVVQQGGRYVFDLASQYTLLEVHGHPGKRGWKVLFPRRDLAPFRVDASMVDPDDFMRVLRFFRPQLVKTSLSPVAIQ